MLIDAGIDSIRNLRYFFQIIVLLEQNRTLMNEDTVILSLLRCKLVEICMMSFSYLDIHLYLITLVCLLVDGN